MYKDATGTEVDEEIFSDLVSQGNVVLTVFSNDGEKCKGVIDMMSNGVNSIFFSTNLTVYRLINLEWTSV